MIALFTKFDQFKRNIRMKLEDEDNYSETHANDETERVFKEHYLGSLSANSLFIRLESKDFVTNKSISY